MGAYAFLDRLAAWHIGLSVLRAFGARSGYRVPWGKLDLTDPERPTLTCRVSDLEKLE